MREAGIGRVLVASLHQGIADILPTRLEFYENWLNAEGLRDGTIGLAPLLRGAELPAPGRRGVPDRSRRAPASTPPSGPCESMPPLERALITAAPRVAAQPAAAAARAAPRAQQLPRQPRARRGCGAGRRSVDLRASIFCTVREPVAAPALRLLRGGVHAAAGAVRHRGAAPRSSRAAAPASRPASLQVAPSAGPATACRRRRA